jgi:dihydrofolate reductase
MATLSLIAALDRNRVIGAGGKMPWHLPEDLKYFKRVTSGYPIIMGRKTYESIGRLLPGRENRIVSRQAGYSVPGARVFTSIGAACAGAGEGELFVIGGAEIYKQALPLAKRLYLTMIDSEFEGDTYFPQWDVSEFHEVSRESFWPDPAAGRTLGFDFVVLERVGR